MRCRILARNRDCVDLGKMASILEERVEGAAGPTSQDREMNFYEVEIPIFEFYLCIATNNNCNYCMLKIEAFVVVLIWSLGLIYATDWILKYSPTPLRLL
jgi:hypothetical protein